MNKKIICLFVMLTCTFCCNVFGYNFYSDSLYSDSIYMINEDTGIPIIEKNINKRRSPASLTKIVTFIVAYENIPDKNTTITVSQEILDMMDPDSSGADIKAGEEFSVIQLLHYMMISSSGPSAMVLANYVGGNVDNFVSMMNKKVQELGCADTHFENPDGIYNSNQYSTASDMYKITKYAMNNKDFLNIVSKSEYEMFGDERDPIVTTNSMIDRKRGGKYYLPCVKGIKTGYIKDAGKCLVSYAVKDNTTHVCIVMGGPITDEEGNKIQDNTAMLDTFNLYNWAYSNLKTLNICDKYFPLTEVKTKFILGKNKLVLSPETDINLIVPKDAQKNDISFEFDTPEYLEAPVETGIPVGKVFVLYNGEKITSFNLVSTKSFKKNYILVILDLLYKIITSKIFIFSLIVIVLLVLFYIYITIKYNRKIQKNKKVVSISKFKNDK